MTHDEIVIDISEVLLIFITSLARLYPMSNMLLQSRMESGIGSDACYLNNFRKSHILVFHLFTVKLYRSTSTF